MSTTPSTASTSLLAVDTGGTFTDLVLFRGGKTETLKIPSTPGDPSEAVLTGIDTLLADGDRFVLLHGSTVATNALLERRGARVVLVTNEGFEDIIEIGRQNRPQLYALVGHRPPPLVARDDRLGAPGRMGPDGEELAALEAPDVAALVERVRELEPESIAICFLHSYANPAHERLLASALRDPEGPLVGSVPVSVSSEIVPEFREFERTSTTVVNAYVAPLMDRYLGRVAELARADRISIMGSGGGSLPVDRARREPVHTVLSGPAGGVVGALAWARRAGQESIVSFDMGGTSTDVSLCPGRPLRTRDFAIGGQPVSIPVLDIHTVGAGGGSIARVDPGGALRVGPRSAGAEPGPICYGLGGTEVTVTDAHVWLGRLPEAAFLGGSRSLDRSAVEGPLRRIADELGTSLEEAAEGILAVADTAMERALRVISVERGYDPVDFAVVAFGGAGPLHVAELTHRIGARRAIVPPNPGLLSAYGMLASPVVHERSRTLLLDTDTPDITHLLEGELSALEAAARASMIEEGADARDLSAERWIDARYRGQSYELAVPADQWVETFHRAHAERYGYRRDGTAVEAVTVRVVVRSPAPDLEERPLAESNGMVAGVEPIQVFHGGVYHSAGRVPRDTLGAGTTLEGPIVVEEYSGTTWVPPEWSLRVDEWGTLHLTPRTA